MKQRFHLHQSELSAAATAASADPTAAVHSAVLSAADLKVLDSLIANVCDEQNYHVALFPAEQHALMAKLLQSWPADKQLPVLDAYRCLMVHETACDKLGTYVLASGCCEL